MTIPRIPGYTEPKPANSLEAVWARPIGEYPDSFWPLTVLASIVPTPVDWLTVDEHSTDGIDSAGRHCILGPTELETTDLGGTGWVGRELGEVGLADGALMSGLSIQDESSSFEFFAQVRHPVGSKEATVDVTHPFLWCWDAYPTAEGWSYLTEAGREMPLVRVEITPRSWRIQVRSAEFRTYLRLAERTAVLQIDWSRSGPVDDFNRVDDYFECDWGTFHFWATSDSALPDRSIAGIAGQYLIRGAANQTVPRQLSYDATPSYPSFIYETNPVDGTPQHHTCDPELLGNYFVDHGDGRPHYLTTVNFDREVLARYTAAPSRFRVTRSRLECLNLWGISIGLNSIGLVEVYLGDLGRDLPPSEWPHWLGHNVPPEGTGDEGRFRRDFLNQWASTDDPPEDLRRARIAANSVAETRWGHPLFRDPDAQTQTEFESLFGPLSNEPATLGSPVLVLTKVFIDGLNVNLLNQFKEQGDDTSVRSLTLLARLIESIGGGNEVAGVFKDLQALRSRGGVAHLSGTKDAIQSRKRLGIEELGSYEAFILICRKLLEGIGAITDAITSPADGDRSGEDGAPAPPAAG